MSEIKTEHFKVFLEKHAEYHYKSGLYDCIKSLSRTVNLDIAEEEYDKAKESLQLAAKECGIEVE